MRSFLIIFLSLLFCFPAFALDMKDFKTIPVLQDGRLKPLDSFARAELKYFSGADHLKKRTAIDWLAEILFTPEKSITDPVFHISDNNLRHALGVDENDGFLYSFEEIVPGLRKTSPAVTALLARDRNILSDDQKKLLDIHDKAFAYTDLLRSLSLLLPLNIDMPKRFAKRNGQNISWLDLKKLEQDLDSDVKKITFRKGEDWENYSDDEKKTALLSFQIKLMSSAARNSNGFKIIPPQWDNDQGDWHAPWEILQKGEGSPQTAALFDDWRALDKAYRAGDNAAWTVAAQQVVSHTAEPSRQFRLRLEVFQNNIQPFKTSLIFYALAFAAALLFFTFTAKTPRYFSFGFLLAGTLIHAAGIICRVYLLMRPPVGTLYESLLFVSLIIVSLSFFIEKITKNGCGLLIGSFAGTALGLLSLSFAGDGDTMEMLTAVLNTNFWLATHVLCITMGYGWCVLTAILAHLYLASKRFRGETSDFAIHTLAVLSLLFTAIGTILGGIWADQSWGRFWGWDPKENGALLIVLWVIWLLHGKVGKQLNQTQFVAGLAFTNVIVGLSWIGVNLLGVGMHSYGFANGLFYGLGVFILAEIILITFLWKRHA